MLLIRECFSLTSATSIEVSFLVQRSHFIRWRPTVTYKIGCLYTQIPTTSNDVNLLKPCSSSLALGCYARNDFSVAGMVRILRSCLLAISLTLLLSFEVAGSSDVDEHRRSSDLAATGAYSRALECYQKVRYLECIRKIDSIKPINEPKYLYLQGTAYLGLRNLSITLRHFQF